MFAFSCSNSESVPVSTRSSQASTESQELDDILNEFPDLVHGGWYRYCISNTFGFYHHHIYVEERENGIKHGYFIGQTAQGVVK